MDAEELLQHILEEEEQILEEEEEESLATVDSLFLLSYVDQVNDENMRCRARYRFLRRSDLLPTPHMGTPWTQLYAKQADRAFITTMGVDVETFHFLCSHFSPRWDKHTITRPNVNLHGRPRLGRRSLDAAGVLGLVLHFLASTIHNTSLELIFAIVPATLSRYIADGRRILLDVIRTMPEGAIRMPRNQEECEELSSLVVQRHSMLWGAIATGDGLDLPATEPEDPEIENATYSGWKASHFVKNILFWSPKGEILAASFGNPGSWHDSLVARPLYPKLHALPQGFFIVCDSAFPRDESIARRIQVPSKSGECLPDNPDERDEKMRLNAQLLSFRQSAEWGMRILQGSFGRLRVPLPAGIDEDEKQDRNELLELCFRMSNVRARRVGINQIRSVYYAVWRESEDNQLWDDLGGMVFKDIRRSDRVARFHLVAVQQQQ